jgi:Zn finger protein HypA/HybF involved in hydrogenase expression
VKDYGRVTDFNQIQRIIGQKLFLKSDQLHTSILFFYQREFKPISKRQFETSKVKVKCNKWGKFGERKTEKMLCPHLIINHENNYKRDK